MSVRIWGCLLNEHEGSICGNVSLGLPGFAVIYNEVGSTLILQF